MTKYKQIVNDDHIWVAEMRQPGRADICFGQKQENEKRGHAVFISGVTGFIQDASCPLFYRPAEGMTNFISGSNLNLLVIGNYYFYY